MTDRFKRFMDFWLKAKWYTKIFIFLLALMITYRIMTSCIRFGGLFEMGCEDPASYIEED